MPRTGRHARDLRPDCWRCCRCCSRASTGPGADLAERLGVTDRTVRNDVARLRELGYPVDAVRGPGGRYRLGRRRQAAAAAARRRGGRRRRRRAAGGDRAWPASRRPSARALAKLEQVLPDRLRRQLDALRRATSAGPANTDSQRRGPGGRRRGARAISPPRSATTRACAATTGTSRCEIEPYHLVGWQRRWYLVGRDPRRDAWAPYRVDWLRLRTPGGRRFTPRRFPGDLTEFVVREVARTGWAVHARIHVHAPADEVLARINPAVGTVEAATPTRSRPGHRRRQPRGRRGLDRHARPGLHVTRPARAGRARPRAGASGTPRPCRPRPDVLAEQADASRAPGELAPCGPCGAAARRLAWMVTHPLTKEAPCLARRHSSRRQRSGSLPRS